MELKKLQTLSLDEAMRNMGVGETCIAPDGASHSYVRKCAALLKEEGYIFATSTRSGEQTITRLK